jgi:Ca2+:H+ antiporter
MLDRSDRLIMGGAAVGVALAALTRFGPGGPVAALACSSLAIATLAMLVGRSVEQLGERFGPGATSALQTALGNLPELFIAIFALRAGLVEVVQAALIGSILANLLFVLGICFVVGGVRHGPQRIGSARARHITVLMVLSVAGMVLPSLAHYTHTPAAQHEEALSLIVSAILLGLFLLTLPQSLRKEPGHGNPVPGRTPKWTVALAVTVLAASGILAGLVSDWFVVALEPSIHAMGISDAFAGLIIVAIAGNAVENIIGIQLAARNEAEFAFAVVISSPLQIALVLAPVLVIISELFGLGPLTLVFSPMLIISVTLAVILSAFITFDGESDWLEGATLIAVYGIIATTFWWG